MVVPDPSGQPFGEMMAAAKAGDSRAFEAIFRRYGGRMKAFAMTRGADDADGVANDVMLRVFQNLGSFDGDESAFVRWIFTIARNRLVDLHRHAQRRPEIVSTPVPERALASAETVALDRMATRDAAALLETLTDEQREVIALRLIEDLSLADVAEIVGRPITAVKRLQRRGLQRLQKTILDEVVS